VAIIKASRDIDVAKSKLMDRFLLSEIQSQAIVDMRLGRLTSLEVEKLQQELAELKVQIEYLNPSSGPKKLLALIRDEIKTISENSGSTADRNRTRRN